MIKITKKVLVEDIENLPAETGILQFNQDPEVLYITYTNNLRKRMKKLLRSSDPYILKMISLANIIEYSKHESLFEALIDYKRILHKLHPEYNRIIVDHQDYVYLAISFHRPPFFSIADQALGELWYLGPFRNRFFLSDFLDIMHLQFGLPRCDSEEFPCHLLSGKQCSGLCLAENKELFDSICQNYFLADEEKIKLIESEIISAENDLLFEKAELLKQKLEIIRKYYDIVFFLFVTKDLDLDTENGSIQIRKGMLARIIINDKMSEFPIIESVYRNNEYLAIEKMELNERKIIFDHYRSQYSTLFEKLFLKSWDRFLELLSS